MKTKTNRREQSSSGGSIYSGRSLRNSGDSRMVFAHRPPGSCSLTTAWSPESLGAERTI